jgi:AcrR family transcriptional regulator
VTEREKPGITVRKAPRQARSAQLVADILEASARVLAEEGAHRFTTARVAERAGVSVGSLYQYFPNKAAILFRLQTDEWTETGAMMRGILQDPSLPPPARLRRLVHAFVRSECEEAEMRIALDDAAPYYRDAPEAQEPRIRGSAVIRDFMAEALPDVPPETRDIAANLITMMLGDVGKRLSEDRALAGQIDTYADAVADMFAAYLKRLDGDSG